MSGQSGTVFDIKEFAVYDGPGIRTTVFMKGCPLRCQWCHNPEGLSPAPQLMVSRAACVHCGRCEAACTRERCTACGECIAQCALGLRRISGRVWTAQALAEKLRKNAAAFVASGGGVTFSGGEPMMQWGFVCAVRALLLDVHCAIETSGFCSDEAFLQMQQSMDFVMMDVKMIDENKHERYTGVSNGPILRHLDMLKAGKTPYVIRIPLIPGVNDDLENLEATAARLEDAGPLVRVELLPYHQTAGAKYDMAGMCYAPEFDTQKRPEAHLAPFERRGINTMIL